MSLSISNERKKERISLYCLRNLVLILVILYSNRPYSSSIIKSDQIEKKKEFVNID